MEELHVIYSEYNSLCRIRVKEFKYRAGDENHIKLVNQQVEEELF